ncbi:MAG: sulfotransferase family protein [bacterium]|nr:sulfotransferase family protein [Gammaproteobacteria bacterium]HIL98210.1 sulfotransferase family protein [Pseudomonadales bacterium]
MPLKVIGAGFGRTGTLSMKMALEQLGLGPCHHMMEVFGKPDHIALWQAAGSGKPVDWEEVFEGYNSAVDWPVCYFWRELIELYPDAKVILTKRDADAWFKSADSTIFKGMTMTKGALDDPHRNMARTIVVENTFGGDLTDKDNAIKVFNVHNQEVIDTVPADRLLVFEASQGWGPLCDFLEVPVPKTDYPRSNSTDDFLQRFQSASRQD